MPRGRRRTLGELHTTIGAYIPVDLAQAVRKLAIARGISQSQAISQILRRGIAALIDDNNRATLEELAANRERQTGASTPIAGAAASAQPGLPDQIA